MTDRLLSESAVIAAVEGLAPAAKRPEGVAHCTTIAIADAIGAINALPDAMAWQPIETASAVGKKRLMFMLGKGKVVIGFRLSKTALVRPEGINESRLATHWQPLPAPPEQDT